MANELKHKAVGTILTQVEFEATDSHAFANQAAGDILYALSTTQLSKLAKQADNTILTLASGVPAWTATPTLTTVDAGTDFTVGSTVITDNVITFTPTSSDTVTLTAAANGAFSLVTVDDNAAVANIQITADGTVDIDSAGALTLDSGAAINIEPAAGSVILLDGILTIDAGVVVPVATAHNAAGTAISISAGATTAGTTNNIAGGALTIQGGQGKGSGAGGDIIFRTANAGGSGSALNALATALTISDDLSTTFAGTVYVNDTANGNMTTGLTVNMGAADNEILTLKSSDVGHSFTDLTEADTFSLMKKASAASGGLMLESYIDDGNANSFYLRSRAAIVNTTKSTSAYAPIHIQASILDTNTAGAVSADGNLVTIDNLYTVRFIFDAEGSGHADVEWVAYDSHDDLALMDAFQREATGRLTPMRYGDNPLYYHREYMEDIGIVGKDSWHTEQQPDGRVQDRQMVNFTKLAMLHHGAILQMGDALKALEAENRELKALIGGQ